MRANGRNGGIAPFVAFADRPFSARRPGAGEKTGRQVDFGGVMPFSDTSPLGFPVLFAAPRRDLVGGACAAASPGGTRPPASNAADRLRTRR